MYFGHFHPHSSLIFFPLPLNLFFIPMSPSPTSVPSVLSSGFCGLLELLA